MITAPIERLIRSLPFLSVATVDTLGMPHLAIGKHVTVSGDSQLVFDNWFCPVTLQNIIVNKKVAVAAYQEATGNGFQLLGTVVWCTDIARFDEVNDFAPPLEKPEFLTRFIVRVESILEFKKGIHMDLPLAG